MLTSRHTHLGVLIRVIYVTHDNSKTLDYSFSDHVSLILSKHLLQHGQHKGATNLLLQRERQGINSSLTSYSLIFLNSPF